jgi:hypothetical protein
VCSEGVGGGEAGTHGQGAGERTVHVCMCEARADPVLLMSLFVTLLTWSTGIDCFEQR